MLVDQLLSHPNYPLEKHVQGVLHQIEKFFDEKRLSRLYMNDLFLLSNMIGLFHDIGKATGYFQQYIRKENNDLGMLKNHSLISALLLYQFLQYESELKFDDERLRLLAFLIVKKHHGQLNNWLDEFKQFHENEKELLQKQVHAIDFEKLNQSFQSFSLYKPLSKETCLQWIEDLFNESFKIRRKIMKYNREKVPIELYIQYIFLFSILIDADKSEVGILQKGLFPERRKLNYDIVINYKRKQNWDNRNLNELREKAFQEVDSLNIDLNHHFYSLQLPTGFGKTLTSFQFALNLRKKIEQEKGVTSRIVYSLPFLSVIDQTEKVIREIFNINEIEMDQSLLLTHHHLSDLSYTIQKNEEGYHQYDYNAAQLLVEGWNAEIILTTFIQLFHSIFSNKNASLRKFHRFAHSIFIIDEVQAIPHKYWLVVRETLKVLARELDCYFLFSSATIPAIFKEDEMRPLVDAPKYYQGLSRVMLHSHIKEKMTIEQFVNTLNINESKTYLFILNTIDAAKEVYKKLKEIVPDKKITFLSTHIPPIERLKRIGEIKKQKYQIVVSTQLVEAGVDIDFDIVYRDLAPLDSIQQAAGRCNRHGMRKGEIHVVHLTDGYKSFANYIYDGIRLNITQELLKNDAIPEERFFQFIEQYFEQLQAKTANKESLALLNGIQTLYFDGEKDADRIPVSHFQLIEEQYDRMEVFLELDEKSKSLFEHYEKILKIEDQWERKKAFRDIKADFYQYIISIPRKVDNKPPIVNGIGYVTKTQLEDYYDLTLGYKTEQTSLIW